MSVHETNNFFQIFQYYRDFQHFFNFLINQ